MGYMTSNKPSDGRAKLKEMGQEQILQCWNLLSTREQEDLLLQIDQLDVQTYFTQRRSINSDNQPEQNLTPFKDYHLSGSEEDLAVGKQLIAEGKVGCLIAAGGQGSRLGYDGPKGKFPATLVKKKSLFQLFAEKVLAASIQADRQLPLAIMTSSVNHEETVSFFEQNGFFGLEPAQVFFFSQGDLPFLNSQGNFFLETPSKIAAGPNGNAAALKHFVDKTIWVNWYEKGVRYLNYVQIDNPLADPFDAELAGFHHRHQPQLVIKCITRDNPLEKLGVVLRNHGEVQVIEYSEISPEERDARDTSCSLKHLCGNISLFSFKMDFIKEIADQHYQHFPFHKAWKAVKYLAENGETKISEEAQAWKFEKFIFDLLPYATDVKALLYPREVCFAPLKNAKGSDSIVEVQAALQRYDRQTIAKITGIMPSVDKIFELSPQFYYPTQELLARWKGKPLPDQSYIEP